MPRILKTLYEYFALYSSLTLLGLICLAWSAFALPLYFILPPRAGTAVGRFGIMAGFRIYSWSLSVTGTYKLDLRAIAVGDHCLFDALLLVAFAVRHSAAEDRAVELDRGLQVRHRDADMVDGNDVDADVVDAN